MTEQTTLGPGTDSDGEETRPQLLILSLAALGVVFGDIGTSPLYAVRECFYGPHAVAVSTANVLGVLSLILWSLIVVISVKYLTFILRADNSGEGGILALTALVAPGREDGPRKRLPLTLMLGLFGAALLYADGMITPAISVLSAVEGLGIATPVFDPYVLPITIAVLVALFVFQSHGTSRVGAVFGPIILIWFATMAATGVSYLVREPSVLQAVNPIYALLFFINNGWPGFVILGTVFLVVTGGEALYADIGHFGARPIRLSWFSIVLPALLLNYFGQGAFLIGHPAAAGNPFYRMAPEWALYPLVLLATLAAVIASQAVITGAFSLTLQSVQLGYSPRMTIRHTSAKHMGQIYVPSINWALMAACIGLVLGFKSSSNLAAAYGVAITITMVITTLLFFMLVRDRWQWSLPAAILVCGGFLAMDVMFLGANVTKIDDGGWFPLTVAAVVFTLMSTWRRGRALLGLRLRERLVPLELFLAEQISEPPQRVPGTVVYMSGNPVGTPPALRHNVLHNKVLHETVLIVVVETADVPRVPWSKRTSVEKVGAGFWRVIVTYGFMQEPNVPGVLRWLRHPELEFNETDVSYFLGRETLLATERPGMAIWRERLFAWMSRNAQTATSYFNLPPDRVIEIGVQVEL